MRPPSASALRVASAVLLVAALATVGYGLVTSASADTVESHLGPSGVEEPSEAIAPPRENITVVATDSNSWRGETSDGPRARAELIAFATNGTVHYYDDVHTRYWDVDPVPGTETTVEYAYADHLNASECPTEWDAANYAVDRDVWEEYVRVHEDVGACTRNGVERVNLTTGETTRVWSQITPGKEATRYHDIDRLNETHLLVADIYLDRVFVVNADADEITWTWNASEEFPTDSTGGPYPDDWTHINDVEALDDGRIMVSVRNHDRVMFLEPGDGLQEAWTLGAEDDYDALYEQHNPDYIPPENGGPAVVVADSENNRVVEYQRTDGEWERTWLWRDARMQWPRDADRLPNGHTLISDSNGNRVFEVDDAGEVVWSVNVAFPYEAERLGTGDESAGGPGARSADVRSHAPSLGDRFWIAIKGLVPGKYLNGLMYVTPPWMGVPEVFALVAAIVVGLVWTGAELRRRR